VVVFGVRLSSVRRRAALFFHSATCYLFFSVRTCVANFSFSAIFRFVHRDRACLKSCLAFAQTVRDLRALYPDLEDIDLFVGGLAEGELICSFQSVMPLFCSRLLFLQFAWPRFRVWQSNFLHSLSLARFCSSVQNACTFAERLLWLG
jgi:hypothetical protein